MTNQNPEQIARDNIDKQLIECGWIIQKEAINLSAGLGVAVTEYQTEIGPADYVLFVEGKPVGVIEAKKEEEGVHLTIHEDQSKDYADSKLKYLNNDPLPFVYASTGTVTRFTDYRDPKPRSRPVFNFHRPETFQKLLKKTKPYDAEKDITHLPTDGLRDCQISAINKLEISFREPAQSSNSDGNRFRQNFYRYYFHLSPAQICQSRGVLFLVDTKNLGEQAEQEFMAYMPNDDNRKFSELYSVQRLKSSYVPLTIRSVSAPFSVYIRF